MASNAADKRIDEAERVSGALDRLLAGMKDGGFGQMLRDWRWIMSHTEGFRGRIALYALLGVLGSAAGLVSGVASKYVIDVILGFDAVSLWTAALAMAAAAALGIGLTAVTSRFAAALSVDMVNGMQSSVFAKLLDSQWLELNRFGNGDLLSRFSSDVTAVAAGAVSWIPEAVIHLFTFLATFCVILYYDPVMALIALATAPFLLIASRYLLRRQRLCDKRMKEVRSRITGFEAETFYGMDTVKSFGVERHTRDKLESELADFRRASMDYNAFTVKTRAWLSALGTAVTFLAFAYCLWRLWRGDITVGTMTLFLQQRSGLSTAFSGLVGLIPSALSASVSAARVREITELPKEPHGAPAPEAAGGCAIRLDAVDFRYNEENGNVIEGSDFLAEPGEIVAVVGPSGEGKTTLLRLILGLVRPQRGSATAVSDGGETQLSADTRGLFAYVPQGNTVMAGTIAENLRLVKPEATDVELETALRAACAWDFVSKLPQGLLTHVGEGGKGLSEGQAQRVAIARAVLRDAPVLLMDEATSALDIATEREVLRRVLEIRPGRTCIITTHRPSVLGLCKRVYRVVDRRLTRLSDEESGKLVMDF